MKTYLAGRFEDRARLRVIHDQLEREGYLIVARWLRMPDDAQALDPRYDLVSCALVDLQNVADADLFILFTDNDDALAAEFGPYTRGGREVELGYFLALMNRAPFTRRRVMRALVVGPPRNVFHHHAWVERFDDWPSARDRLLRATSKQELS